MLTQLHCAGEKLPQWETSSSTRQWGSATATGSYGNVTLWDTQRGASWWVLPTQPCNEQTDQDCVLVAAELTQVSYHCLSPAEIASGSQPRAVEVGGQWLISGFAPAGKRVGRGQLRQWNPQAPGLLAPARPVGAREPGDVVLKDGCSLSTGGWTHGAQAVAADGPTNSLRRG